MKKLFFLTGLIIFSVLISFSVKAGSSDNVSGYAWSENIGWIDFNCINQDTCAIVDYGVNIDSSSGEFSGHAWSENIGWIDFSPSGPYPEGSDYPASVDMETGYIYGWARALSYGDGWDGWIKLAGNGGNWNAQQEKCVGTNHYENTNRCDWGVRIDMDTGDFSGWAWGNTVVGWIHFQDVKYKVITSFSFNQPPNKPGIPDIYKPSGVTWDNCTFQGKSIPTFHWTYNDADDNPLGTDPQTAYEIRIDDNAGFSNDPDPTEFIDSIIGAGTSYNPSHRLEEWIEWMDWDKGYWWIVRVRDDNDNWSEWLDSTKFDTPIHAYPYPGFIWLPQEPNQKETVIFTPDETDLFYFWTVAQGEAAFVDSTGPTNEQPHIVFESVDNKVKLKITDDDGYCCESDEQEITAQLPLPEYKEVAPIIWLKNFLAGAVKFFNTDF